MSYSNSTSDEIFGLSLLKFPHKKRAIETNFCYIDIKHIPVVEKFLEKKTH